MWAYGLFSGQCNVTAAWFGCNSTLPTYWSRPFRSLSVRGSLGSTGVWNHMHFCSSLAASEDQFSFWWIMCSILSALLLRQFINHFCSKMLQEDQFSLRCKCACVWAIYIHLCVESELFFVVTCFPRGSVFIAVSMATYAYVCIYALRIAKGHVDVWISENPNRWGKSRSENSMLWNLPIVHSSSSWRLCQLFFKFSTYLC